MLTSQKPGQQTLLAYLTAANYNRSTNFLVETQGEYIYGRLDGRWQIMVHSSVCYVAAVPDTRLSSVSEHDPQPGLHAPVAHMEVTGQNVAAIKMMYVMLYAL